ncbi:hypothetical protein HRbin15_01360 [bacterium HR15]|nr:hypothetical protein HRbin15_01360 [bacterium HR15]
MSVSGWIFMLLAWAFIGGLFVYCFYRILFGDARPTGE